MDEAPKSPPQGSLLTQVITDDDRPTAGAMNAPGDGRSRTYDEIRDDNRKKAEHAIRLAASELTGWFRPIVGRAVSLARTQGYLGRPWPEGATEGEIAEVILGEVVDEWYRDHDERLGEESFVNRADEHVVDLLLIVRSLKPIWEAHMKTWWLEALDQMNKETTISSQSTE